MTDTWPEVIKQFCDQCYTIRALHKEYFYLYESDNKERLDLLDKTARDFFRELQGILKDRIFLEICKITDPIGSGERSNFTIEYILKEIKRDSSENLGLDELSKEIHKFREHIVPARNKIIGHSDFETITSDRTLGVFSKGAYDKFWDDLQKFVNKIHNHYFKSPYILDDVVNCTFNAKDLVWALKKAAYFDQYFKNVLHSELLEEETFKYRNA
jgi:hypothetical protein